MDGKFERNRYQSRSLSTHTFTTVSQQKKTTTTKCLAPLILLNVNLRAQHETKLNSSISKNV